MVLKQLIFAKITKNRTAAGASLPELQYTSLITVHFELHFFTQTRLPI